MDPKIIAALIAAATVLLAFILRDMVAWYVKERFDQAKGEKAVFRSYADPLLSSSESLLWRLDEIINSPGRGAFLLDGPDHSHYAEYKKISTIYRLAAVVGWLRAYERELAVIRAENHQHSQTIRSSIRNFQSSLADGAAVELSRLRGLLKLWQIKDTQDAHLFEATAIAIENKLDEYIHDKNASFADQLDPDQKMELCRQICVETCRLLRHSAPNDAILEETCVRAIKFLSYREAWFYRDWQSGLGDFMIRATDSGVRKYEVVGFGEFEDYYIENSNKWVRRISSVFEGVDISQSDEFDARHEQIRTVLSATAEIIIAISDVDPKQKELSAATIAKARNVRSQLEVARPGGPDKHNN